ncbi:MAG: TPM domain-containing protein [Bacteroidota bacterium]
MKKSCTKYDDSTSNQVVVVIISSLQDYPIEDVALRILRDWGEWVNKDKK